MGIGMRRNDSEGFNGGIENDWGCLSGNFEFEDLIFRLKDKDLIDFVKIKL